NLRERRRGQIADGERTQLLLTRTGKRSHGLDSLRRPNSPIIITPKRYKSLIPWRRRSATEGDFQPNLKRRVRGDRREEIEHYTLMFLSAISAHSAFQLGLDVMAASRSHSNTC